MLDLKMISKDGKSKCMDSTANGYARAEAVVAIFLQKRSDSRRIYATILNSKTNADGWKPEGVTFPGIDGQAKLLKATYSEIGLDPLEISYIEAHCTGTAAGDPVELNAIHRVICCDGQDSNQRTSPLLVGCIKSNIGHSEGASGLCALIKSLLILQTKLIPPNLHLESPNLAINGLSDGSMKPVTSVTPFESDTIPINCFGFGGANVHVVIKAEERKQALESYNICNSFPRLVNICARTSESISHLVEYLDKNRSKLTKEFLYLLNEFSKSSITDFPFRSYVVLSKQTSLITGDSAQVKSECSACLYFSGIQQDFSSVVELFQIPQFAMKMKIIQEITLTMGIDLGSCLKKISRSKLEDSILTLAVEASLIDVIKAAEVKVSFFSGSGIGELACAFYDGILTLEHVLLSAFAIASCNGSTNCLEACFKKLLPGHHPRKRSSRWVSEGSVFATPEYFVSHVIEPKEVELNEKEAELNKKEVELNKFPPTCPTIEIGSRGLRILEATETKDTSHDASLATIQTLGQLYAKGCSVNVEYLYPYVKLPLPTWVPSLSPLIKWDHSMTWDMTSRLIQLNDSNSALLSTTIPFTFDRFNPEDSFLFDHKIDGRILFPASGHFAMAWFALSKMLSKPLFNLPVEFKDVTIEKATVLSPSKSTSFIVRMNTSTGSFVVKEGDTVVVSGSIFPLSSSKEDFPRYVKCSDDPVTILQSNDIYKEFRIRGYDYDPFFQGLSTCRSDGKEGSVIWRDVVSASAKETLNLESEDDRVLFWLRSWILLIDSMIQLTLFDDRDVGRGLKVPTKLQSLTCYPRQFENFMIHDGTTIPDPLTLGSSKQIMCTYNSHEDVIKTTGIRMRGLETSLLKRTPQFVRIKKYCFIPFNESDTFVSSNGLKRSDIMRYHSRCLEASERIVSNSFSDEANERIVSNSFSDEVASSNCSCKPEQSLLHILLNHDQRSHGQQIDLNRDLLLGCPEDERFYPDRFLGPFFDTVICNLITKTGETTLKITEITSPSSTFNLCNKFHHLMEESLFSDQTSIHYNIIDSMHSKIPQSELIIFRDFRSDPDLTSVFKSMYQSLTDGGFVMVISNELASKRVIFDALEKLSIQSPSYVKISSLIVLAEKFGFVRIGQKKLLNNILSLSVILFRKPKMKTCENIVLNVGLLDYDKWLDVAKEVIRRNKNDNKKRIWLVPSLENRLYSSGVSGLVGFVKSLKLEPGGGQIRCILDWTCNSEVSFEDGMYQDVLEKDLVFNIREKESSGWGSYEHISSEESESTRVEFQGKVSRLREEKTFDPVQEKNLYLRSLKPGDFSSLVWTEGSLYDTKKESLITVNYAALNFKDVMYASGRLPLDSVKGIDPLIAQDSLLGMEFAGHDSNNNRLMGVVPFKALATKVLLTSENSFVIPVPPDWTLEEASTIPVVYSTAFYGLVVRGNLRDGETVLIHSGAGGVGMAALNICLAKNCEIYVTVGSGEKAKFLLKQFPRLKESHIFNSRDTTFEENILRATNGRGVDIVLNSLSGERLKASLRCLSTSTGRFIEIGKVDLLANTALLMQEIEGSNITLHGVYPETFFCFNEKRNHFFPPRMIREQNYLRHLIIQGIADGVVKPLKRTVFGMNQVEEAFRFMSTGKHVGKVVIKMEQSGKLRSPRSTLNIQKRSFFHPHKSYLVIGGLGGFGLELIQWMAERGGRHIVINSRRGVRDAYQQYTIDKLMKIGVEIILSQFDSGTKSGIQSLVNLTGKYGPLGGVFNTAAVFDDMLFEDQTVHTFDQVCAPKLAATFYLDKVTRSSCHNSLDLFVAFSSISGSRGNPGQTSYNFANSVIDTICEGRVRDGLPGLSIQWGVVGDVGYVANRSNSNNTVILGLSGQRIHSCLSSLDHFLQSPDPVVCCYVTAEKDHGSHGIVDSTDVLKVISRILGLKDIQSIDSNTTLSNLGIDSLIAVEIQQILEKLTGSRIPLKQVKELKLSQFISMTSSDSNHTSNPTTHASKNHPTSNSSNPTQITAKNESKQENSSPSS